ncbi:ABC transporter permease [Paenibacillus silvae]|uniref:ABC transporter permease n=1 Tax=Paenibacillus silvae TaxID=1325358 RepID=A0A2W6NAU2_9BACL|nr:FtsX-like permease family protein [Paenibacillus silvae]PZT53097.1 ABC transporter permease [Paenibacillus silvae]
MAVILKLGHSYLRKNKTQNLFIALLILLSTLLVCTSVIILANTGNQFKEMHSRTNGSHQILTFDKGLNDPQTVYDWWAAQNGVQISPLLAYRTLSGITFEGKDIANLYLYMMNTTPPPWKVDQLLFASGQESSTPAQGSVWIPTSMANSYNITVGDTVHFKTGTAVLHLTVSAVVIDVPYGAPFTNTARIWMHPTDYENDFGTFAGKEHYMMGMHFDDYDSHSSYWDRYTTETGAPFLESIMDFESISSFYLIINQMIGFIMIFLGVVMLLIALITIGFTLSDAILANYKTIGILKSLGLTSRHIVSTYVVQYALLSIIAVLPGLVLSMFVSRFIIRISVSSLQTDHAHLVIEGIGMAVFSGLLLLVLIIGFIVIYASKTRMIEPAQAIRYGMSERDNMRLAGRMNSPLANRVLFGRFPVSWVIGLRNLIKNRKSSVLMLLLTMTAASVLVFGYVVLSSINGIDRTAAKWGYDNANIAAIVVDKMTFSRAEMQHVLEEDSRITAVGWRGNVTGITLIPSDVSSDAASQSFSLNLSVLDGRYTDFGFETLRGHNPERVNEISIGVNAAKRLNKQLGDLIELYIEGEKRTFIISGIYQAISNMSLSGRITAEAVRSVNPDYDDADVAFINIIKPSQAEVIAAQLNERFKASASIVTQKMLLDSLYAEAAHILMYPMALFGLLFILVTFIIIFITCRISIRKESRTYGIHKSIGMTSGRIRSSITLGVAGLSLIGSTFGVFVGMYLLPLLLEKVLSGYGIVQIPLVLNWGGMLLIACLGMLAAVIGCWLASREIRQMSPRMLVIE